MRKITLGVLAALVAVSFASPALADNDKGERGERNGQRFEKFEKQLSKFLRKESKRRKNDDACVSAAKTAYSAALKSAYDTMKVATKAAHDARVSALVAAQGNQAAIDAAWSAYRSAWLSAWTAYANAVTSAMTSFGTARAACDQNPVVTPTPSPAKAITSFNFTSPAVAGAINETTHTIALTVPFGTNVSALAPTIVHTGASISPASGVAQNFTSPVTYTVTAANGTTQAYVVTVSVALNTAKAITSFSFASPAAVGVINESAHTIVVSVPNGTNVTALVPSIVITGASVAPNSGTAQNFTNPLAYTVTAANGSVQTYVVTVNVLP